MRPDLRTTAKSTRSIALAAFLAAVFVGCGSDGRIAGPGDTGSDLSATAPTLQGSLSSGSSPGKSTSSNSGKKLPTAVPNPITNTVEGDSAWIDAKGGKIKAGLFELDIPHGAVHEAVRISVIDYSGSTGQIECELLPHGLHFDVPVQLTVKLPDGVKPELLALYWIVNEGLPMEIWSPMPTRAVSGGGKIVADLEHFSRYAPGTLDGKAGWRELPGRGDRDIIHSGGDDRP